MKAKFKTFIDCCKRNPIVTGVCAILFLAFCMGMCGCTDDGNSGGTNLPNIADVSGVYVISEGYQTIKDNQGRDEKTEFALSDNIKLFSMQSGNAYQMFTCLGVLNKDLVVKCDYKEHKSMGGIEGCQEVTGEIKFTDDGAEMKIRMEMEYPAVDYVGESDVEIKLLFVKPVCDCDNNDDS